MNWCSYQDLLKLLFPLLLLFQQLLQQVGQGSPLLCDRLLKQNTTQTFWPEPKPPLIYAPPTLGLILQPTNIE